MNIEEMIRNGAIDGVTQAFIKKTSDHICQFNFVFPAREIKKYNIEYISHSPDNTGHKLHPNHTIETDTFFDNFHQNNRVLFNTTRIPDNELSADSIWRFMIDQDINETVIWIGVEQFHKRNE